MYREIALERIARDMPEVASVIVLRNPIDRAISAYALHAEKYQGLSFRQAADHDKRLVERGFYTRHLETVYRHLPRERVKLLFYDDVARRLAACSTNFSSSSGSRRDSGPLRSASVSTA
jgi:hypothetical protein